MRCNSEPRASAGSRLRLQISSFWRNSEWTAFSVEIAYATSTRRSTTPGKWSASSLLRSGIPVPDWKRVTTGYHLGHARDWQRYAVISDKIHVNGRSFAGTEEDELCGVSAAVRDLRKHDWRRGRLRCIRYGKCREQGIASSVHE